MERTDNLGVRVPAELKAKLIEAARAADRSLASLVNIVLQDWVDAAGKTPGRKAK